ncbi:hypothetical protein J3Q64DRAFT_1819879 [Phycomyces blakesleeanus]|uniref:HMG box domain-containing protein n=2 Tax=Phycomyces blakesleeanus TaxID=4837 RepID=A0A162TVG8_PHYB8|nr:hypothetical protein PHYBLDRAFT_148709 [Phycomyces blakesleeanus NRRL 1555(-)]OAD70153.1 hypothetical protein PHYBLDRAFT_148709 [Phycomyces blakesleeanus NRRL 1555(-)]|eukprot:XP_018288193.1 hypothetical protein PHYBLDRAFT_148709 [Phycomyces blakesleeanus NRRL 1555(-)]
MQIQKKTKSSSRSSSKTKSNTNPNQPIKIPRPMNCFLAYRLAKQSEIVARCPGANHRDISKIIAKWWKEATEEEKAPFREQAVQAKVEHAKMYPNYKYTPQKRPNRVTRKYTMRPKDQFTSKIAKNNRIMERLFEDRTNLENFDTTVDNIPLEEIRDVKQGNRGYNPVFIVQQVSPPVVYSNTSLWQSSQLSHNYNAPCNSSCSPRFYGMPYSPYSDGISSIVLSDSTTSYVSSVSTPQAHESTGYYSPSMDYFSEGSVINSHVNYTPSQTCIDPRLLCSSVLRSERSGYNAQSTLSHW